MPTPAKIAICVSLAVGTFFAGYMANRRPDPALSSASAKQVLYYTCPMHPQYRADRPGDAPCCGMRLVPVYAGARESSPESSDRRGAVRVTPAGQQLIGVTTEEVKQTSAARLLRVPGRIAADEQRLYRLTAGTDGWIRELGENSTGTFVRKGQKLASYYAQNLLAAAQTYVFAVQTNAQMQSGDVTIGAQRTPTALNLQVVLDSLRTLGMSDAQLEDVRRTRVAPTQIYLYSPVNGFVLVRNVSPVQRFDKGAELYRIADLSRVWVMTDIFERDREFVKPGMMAIIRYRGRELHARMSHALPQFDPQSRTLKTRFELDNPGNLLRPDMFVDVEIEANTPAAIVAPADAVVDSGLRKTVFVDRGNGEFEPRHVETGWRLGDRVQITKGLEPGERIVTAGNFLIDSESRMRLAAVSSLAVADKTTQKDPVCGMGVESRSGDVMNFQYRGKTYYFCSGDCKKAFESEPEEYISKKAIARKRAGEPGA